MDHLLVQFSDLLCVGSSTGSYKVLGSTIPGAAKAFPKGYFQLKLHVVEYYATN